MMSDYNILAEKEEKPENYIEEEETSINSDFDGHLDRLIEKLSLNHTTFFNEIPADEEPLEDDKFKTSRLKQIAAVSLNYDRIMRKVSQRSIHSSFMNELL